MAKKRDQPIAAPAPTRGQRLDTGDLEALLRANCLFDGMDTGAVMEAATRWASAMDVPVKQALTVAWRCYWRMNDERQS